jgi:hypothetical protein
MSGTGGGSYWNPIALEVGSAEGNFAAGSSTGATGS